MLRKKKKNGSDDIYADVPVTDVTGNSLTDMTTPDSTDEIEEKDDKNPLEPGLVEEETNLVENGSEIPDFIEENDDSDAFSEMQQAFEAWLEDAVDDENIRQDARCAMSRVGEAIKEGNFDDALFDVIAKGADYDRAVREAQENGEIMGRNARIEELLADRCQDDGVPHPCGSGRALSGRTASIFDIARDAY